jgi:hypothetical protein
MLQWLCWLLVDTSDRIRHRSHAGEEGIETTEVAVIAGAVVALAIALVVILTHFVMGQVSNLSTSGGT